MAFFNINAGKAIQGTAQIYAGVSAYQSALGQASLLEEQGSLTRDDYFRQANLVREEGHRFRAKQTMDFISAGVEIVGTPQLVLKETLSKSTAKAGSLDVTGANYEKLYKRKADITRNEGMASMISGALMGAGTIAETVTW